MSFSIIAAVSKNGIIGDGPNIPWKIPGEQKRFKELTMGKTIIMGRKTYDSIGRPLPGRHTIVVSRDKNLKIPKCDVINSVKDVFPLKYIKEEFFIAGGAEIYKEFIPHTSKIYLSLIRKEVDGDIEFPKIPEYFDVKSAEEINAIIPYTVMELGISEQWEKIVMEKKWE